MAYIPSRRLKCLGEYRGLDTAFAFEEDRRQHKGLEEGQASSRKIAFSEASMRRAIRLA